MVKCEIRGGRDMGSVSSVSARDDDDNDDNIREGEEVFFLKGAWEQVLDLCQNVYHVPSSHESQSLDNDLSFPLTESKKKEIGRRMNESLHILVVLLRFSTFTFPRFPYIQRRWR